MAMFSACYKTTCDCNELLSKNDAVRDKSWRALQIARDSMRFALENAAVSSCIARCMFISATQHSARVLTARW